MLEIWGPPTPRNTRRGTYILKHTHTQTQTHTYVSYIRPPREALGVVPIHTHTHTQTHTCTRTRTRTRARTHTHTHTHARAHTHVSYIHTYAYKGSESRLSRPSAPSKETYNVSKKTYKDTYTKVPHRQRPIRDLQGVKRDL